MNHIPTAEEFFNKYSNLCHFEEGDPEYLVDEEDFLKVIVEYAKLHVEAALKAASEQVNLIARHYNAKTEETTFEPCEGDVYWEGHPEDQSIPDLTIEVDKQSILNAYPKENII